MELLIKFDWSEFVIAPDRKGIVKNKVIRSIVICFAFVMTAFVFCPTVSDAASVKISYGGKEYTNTSSRLKVKFGSTLISEAGYEALEIGGVYMAPYNDVLSKAAGMELSYDETAKTISAKCNSHELIMTVGSKNATLDGASVTLAAKVLNVKFLSTGVSKVLIPVEDVCGKLTLYCRRTESSLIIRNPYKLDYDGNTTLYNGIRGEAFYNHKKISLESMSFIKLDSTIYASAVDVFKQLFGYEVTFNTETGEFLATNSDIATSVSFITGESSFVYKKNSTVKTITLKNPTKLITKNDVTVMPCIPVKEFLDQLDCTNSWSSTERLYYIQNENFFNWSVTAPAANKKQNHIYKATGKYNMIDDYLGSIKLTFYGDLQTAIDKSTISRDKNIIKITMPSSVYMPAENYFDKFGEIVEKMEIATVNDSVVVTLTCFETTEFTYTTSDKKLCINLIWDYSSLTGKISNYSMTIKRPEGVFMNSVSNIDCYDAVSYKKVFKIIIKGDYTDFYKHHPVVINNNNIKQVKISKSDAGNTVITVYTKSLQGYKIYKKDKYFVVSIGKPSKIYKNIVVLDAGHGGYDFGAVHNKVNEKDLNFKMIYTLMKSKFKSNDGDTKVYWTRRSDTFITLDTRAKFAKKVGADMFISLHMNSALNTKANGTEVYYSVSNNKKAKSGLRSSILARKMKDKLISDLGTINRGVRTAGFYVIKNNTVPAILVELGFLSGDKDHKKLTDSDFQKKATKSISSVIKSVIKKYPSK